MRGFLALILLHIRVIIVNAQHDTTPFLKLPTGFTCTEALSAFEKKYNVMVAYDPGLFRLVNRNERMIEGASMNDLFSKLCQIFQLEYIIQDVDKFLVRSAYQDVIKSENQLVHLRVKEPNSKYAIPYATVYDDTGKLLAFTDGFGDCFIKVPDKIGSTKWVISALGHHDLTFHPDTSRYHEVVLPFDPVVSLPVIIHTLKNRFGLNKGQSMDIQSQLLKKLADKSLFYSDAIRTIQLFPGINNTADHRSSIRIRGSGEEATMLVLDHMPVFKADHYFGVFGAFNSQYISNAQIFRNNIPVNFGGRTAGLALFQSDTLGSLKNIQLDIHLIGAGLAAQIPITHSIQCKIAARKTYMDFISNGIADLSERDDIETQLSNNEPNNTIVSKPSHDFEDLNAQIRYTARNFTLEANTFLNADRYLDSYMHTFFGKLNSVNQESYTQNNKWKNRSYNLVMSQKLSSHVLQGSMYTTSWSADYAINSILIRKGGLPPINDTVTLANYNFIQDRGFKLEWSLPDVRNITVGLEHVQHENEIFLENSRNPIFEVINRGAESNLYAKATFKNRDAFLVEPGIRATYLYNLGRLMVLPQIYTSYNLNNRNFLKFSAGRHMQYVRLLDHENVIGQRQQFFALSNNTSIPLGIGNNYMLGYWLLAGDLRLDIETYFRTLSGALFHATKVPGLRPSGGAANSQDFTLFSGKSRTFGSDVTLVYEKGKHFSMLTYTLSKSENSFRKIFKGQYFPTPEDSRHQLKWVYTYTFGKIDASVTYSGATGRPYLDLSGLKNDFEREELEISRYLKNLKNYHRLDVGVGYTINIGNIKTRCGVSAFNLMNRVNTLNRQFLFQIPGVPGQPGNPVNTILGSEASQLERTWNFSLQFSLKDIK